MSYHEPQCAGHKVCSTCGESKHVLAFAIHLGNKDGIEGVCRSCSNLRPSHVKAMNAGRLKTAQKRVFASPAGSNGLLED